MLYVATIIYVIASCYTIFNFTELGDINDTTILNIIVWLSLSVSLSPFTGLLIHSIIGSVVLILTLIGISIHITRACEKSV